MTQGYYIAISCGHIDGEVAHALNMAACLGFQDAGVDEEGGSQAQESDHAPL